MNASLALNIGMATAEYFTRGNHKHFVLMEKILGYQTIQ